MKKFALLIFQMIVLNNIFSQINNSTDSVFLYDIPSPAGPGNGICQTSLTVRQNKIFASELCGGHDDIGHFETHCNLFITDYKENFQYRVGHFVDTKYGTSFGCDYFEFKDKILYLYDKNHKLITANFCIYGNTIKNMREKDSCECIFLPSESNLFQHDRNHFILFDEVKGLNNDGKLINDTSKIRGTDGKLLTGKVTKILNHQVQWEMQVFNGLRDGLFEEYYCDDTDKKTDNFETYFYNTLKNKFIKEKTSTSFYQDDKIPFPIEKDLFRIKENIKLICHFNRNQLEGQYITYSQYGKPYEILSYKQGRLNGVCYYLNNYNPASIEYKNGVKQGFEIKYNQKGELTNKNEFVNNKIALTESYSYNINNDIRYFKTSKRSGSNIESHELMNSDGIKTIFSFKNGKMVGPMRKYYASGKLMSQSNYVTDKSGNSVNHGLNLDYYESGQLESKSNYVFGKKSGKSYSYYENGKIESILPYVDGKSHGEAFYYNENGIVIEKCSYKNDELDGYYFFYNNQGKLIRKNLYRNGTLIF